MPTTDMGLGLRRALEVDQAVRQRGWSLALAHDLAEKWGCDERTVRRYWHRGRKWTQSSLAPGDLEMWRAEQLQALSDISREARENRDYSAASRAIEVQAKIVGTISPIKVDARVSLEGAVVVIPEVLDAASGRPRVVEVPVEPPQPSNVVALPLPMADLAKVEREPTE
jgi:hypothetical protein